MTTSLITGANKGLGFETARQLVAAGHQVWIGARDRGPRTAGRRSTGRKICAARCHRRRLRGRRGRDRWRTGRARQQRRHQRRAHRPSEATADDMRTVYETNVFGPVRVLHAFIPLLEKSEAPVVVNVSSGVGSLGLAADPDGPWSEANYPVYASSKAALNMLTIRYAAAFPRHADQLRRSGLHSDRLQPASRHADRRGGRQAIIRYALITPDGPTGGFFDRNGAESW